MEILSQVGGFFLDYDAGQDDCIVADCINGGVCVDGIYTFVCVCPEQYYGPSCEFFDDCIGVTCGNGAECLDGPNEYMCDCPAVSSGKHCETWGAVDECSSLNTDVVGGGTCLDGVYNYTIVYDEANPTVFLRSSASLEPWTNQAMQFIGPNSWVSQLYNVISSETVEFRIDIHGDWSLNYGNTIQ